MKKMKSSNILCVHGHFSIVEQFCDGRGMHKATLTIQCGYVVNVFKVRPNQEQIDSNMDTGGERIKSSVETEGDRKGYNVETKENGTKTCLQSVQKKEKGK